MYCEKLLRSHAILQYSRARKAKESREYSYFTHMQKDLEKYMSNTAKIAAAEQACTYIKNGMRVGLGTGSTSSFFIAALARKNLDIICTATSLESERQALDLGMKIATLDSLLELDIAVDGADAVDPQNRLIKGYGGALLREKIVASSSKKFIVIIDQSKAVESLNKHLLPVEVIPFAHHTIYSKIKSIGCIGKLRMQQNIPYITDNGNYIYDISIPPEVSIEKLNLALHLIPGVVCTGFFFNLAKLIITGCDDGTTTTQEVVI